MARPGLDKDVKFRRLVNLLGEPRSHVRGYLECLWDVAYEHGNPRIGDAKAVALACDYPGKPAKLIRALVGCGGKGRAGFLELTGSGREYQIHDLYDHAPDYVRRRMDRETERRARGKTISDERARAGQRGAETRWGKTAENKGDNGNCPTLANPQIANGATPAPAPTLAPAPAPALAPAPAPAPQEEDCGEPAPPASPPTVASAGEVELVMDFPIVGISPHGARTWHLTRQKLAEYQDSFPGVDALAECRKARQWCLDNPVKRKTARGMTAFLGRWLARAQDQGPRPPPRNGRNSHGGTDEWLSIVKGANGGES